LLTCQISQLFSSKVSAACIISFSWSSPSLVNSFLVTWLCVTVGIMIINTWALAVPIHYIQNGWVHVVAAILTIITLIALTSKRNYVLFVSPFFFIRFYF